MIVHVLLFAAYAEALGADQLSVEVPDGSVLQDVVAALRGRQGGNLIPEQPLVARNQRYATLADLVESADEIAVIPPVAGG